MDFVIVYTAPKVKHCQSIFLENTVELSNHEIILVTFLNRQSGDNKQPILKVNDQAW